jgi:DNA-directed RNA polymerase subunit omega
LHRPGTIKRHLISNNCSIFEKFNGGFVARITIEDCLKRVQNRFLLVNMVAKRVRQIREGSEYLVSSPKNEDIVVSLREIAAGKITIKEEEENP